MSSMTMPQYTDLGGVDKDRGASNITVNGSWQAPRLQYQPAKQLSSRDSKSAFEDWLIFSSHLQHACFLSKKDEAEESVWD